VHDEGELQLHRLVDGIGMAHLPTLALLMAVAQWKFHDYTEGHVVPLKIRRQFCHTYLLSWLPISVISSARHHLQLR
jgi:hypothetical protein